MKLPKFLVGLLIGGLFGIIFWYWQKSTSAEDGALDVLDRLAASDARVRDLEEQLSADSPPAVDVRIVVGSTVDVTESVPDNLQEIDGIGPTYAERLQEAGINSYAALASKSPGQILDITGIRSEQTAEKWIAAAQALAGG